LPIANFSIADLPATNRQAEIGNWQSEMLLRFLMVRVFTAAPAELTKLQTIGRGFLVLRRYIIATLAISTLQYDVVPRHKSSLQNSVLSALYFAVASGRRWAIFPHHVQAQSTKIKVPTPRPR